MENNHDPVNRPSHYMAGKIEVIDFIEDQQFNYHIGNAIKYLSRYRHKGAELQDLKKAAWYINREIERVSKALPKSRDVRGILSPEGDKSNG